MKIILVFLSLVPVVLTAQFVAPLSSPPAEVTVTVGYTEFTLTYHRPTVRDRIIFGELLPWDQLWRAGANENTLLTANGTFSVGDTTLAAGKYSLYLIPSARGEWTWVVNRDTRNWGTRGYDHRMDVVRVPVKAQRLPERINTLEYRWMNLRPQTAELALEWEWYRVALPMRVPTDTQVADRVATALNPAGSPADYYSAARYYLDNGLNLQKAKAWMDRWAAAGGEERYGPIRDRAVIEYRLGNSAKAKRLMAQSLQLAREKGDAHYVRMNEESLRRWTREATDISPDSLLVRSIRYHDPDSVWGKKALPLQLAESRPGGDTRNTRLTLYPGSDEFDFLQVRGKDKVQLRYLDGAYSSSYQGRTEIADSTRQRLRLTAERTRLLRDYYTYLWGLPMKLRDPGTVLQPTVHRAWFDGRELLELEVHYAPEAGEDVWFFYFDPETYALSGYAFYHAKDGPGTGEYIHLEGEAEINGIKMPAERHWYNSGDKLYLGTDEIIR